jgi:hypothetical protein
VGNDNDVNDRTDDALGGTPDPVEVEQRAEGRPPEERSSEDPAAQAQAILQESEDRIADGASKADS